jgi:hypothetical protein
MSIRANSQTLASQARRLYAEHLIAAMAAIGHAVLEATHRLVDKPAEHATKQRRRDLLDAMLKSADAWQQAVVAGVRDAYQHGVSATRMGELPTVHMGSAGIAPLSLVDDDVIEREILTSRLALAIMDKASWEFTDLRSRVAGLEKRADLEPHDLLRAHVLARIAVDAWRGVDLRLDGWRDLQASLHDEFAALVEEAYHEVNRWLVSQQVMPEVDLRPFIRRTRASPTAFGAATQFGDSSTGAVGGGGYGGGGGGGGGGGYGDNAGGAGSSGYGGPPSTGGYSGRGGAGPRGAGAPGTSTGTASGATTGYSGVGTSGFAGGETQRRIHEETRLMTRTNPLPRGSEHAEAVLGRLNRLVGRHLPSFGKQTGTQALSPGLSAAINVAQDSIRQRITRTTVQGVALATTPALLAELNQRKQQLKAAASSPEERATIEIVALLFQSILTEERIPAAVRVWFARLQMPVLRVAVGEPDFFATVDHPARRLIDRMGACVMGFDKGTVGKEDGLEKEIKRVVQVVEAYPDTGRRVFQTVLNEFEKFLEHFLSSRDEATRKAVSLAQQVEQRETLAIQYTIELRRMLNEVPVQEGVRQFLFHTWADVLATSGVRYGAQSEQAKTMKKVAADLIWSASAKVTREERAEVIRRLPPLLKSLREGMASAGLDTAKQDDQIRQLNNSLAAAFTAKAAVIPHERLRDLMERLESLEEMLPEAGAEVIDESMVLDISGHESSELEVVGEGGSMPTPAMVAWARELQPGSWFMLEYRNRNDAVQLVWHGMRKQLSLFVTAQGRCVLFPQHRLAAFLQAGLLLPAQDEALTVRATRNALAKLDVEPARLLS